MSAPTQTADIHWMSAAQARLDRYEAALGRIANMVRPSKGGGMVQARQVARAALEGDDVGLAPAAPDPRVSHPEMSDTYLLNGLRGG